MAQANINIRTDADLKRDFETLCQDIGMSVTTAFNIFMKQSVRENRLPITLKGDKYAISKEELLERIALMDEGYKVEKTMEELEAMEEGMTDLQFKSYIRKLLSMMEDATEDSDKEELLAVINKLRRDLEEDLRG